MSLNTEEKQPRQNALLDEIRELQSQLATQESPAGIEAAQQRIRELEAENSGLLDDLDVATQRSSSLGRQLDEVQAELASLRESAVASLPAAAPEPSAASATTPRPSVSTTSVGDAGGDWFVNFGSFSERGVAQRWADEINVSSGTLSVQEATVGGRTLYRVRVTDLADRETAQEIAGQLEQEFNLQRLWIGRSEDGGQE